MLSNSLLNKLSNAAWFNLSIQIEGKMTSGSHSLGLGAALRSFQGCNFHFDVKVATFRTKTEEMKFSDFWVAPAFHQNWLWSFSMRTYCPTFSQSLAVSVLCQESNKEIELLWTFSRGRSPYDALVCPYLFVLWSTESDPHNHAAFPMLPKIRKEGWGGKEGMKFFNLEMNPSLQLL